MTSGPLIRVLVVDDSAFARRVLRLSLTADTRIEVVGTARDGLDALEKINALQPDVVTLDLMMPELDGIGVLRALGSLEKAPAVVLVTSSGEDSELAIEALELGAVELVVKPTSLASDRLYDVSGPMLQAVLRASQTRRPTNVSANALPTPPLLSRSEMELVVVGVSTGGPQALHQLLAGFPPTLPVPIAIALHIPGDYTDALARRLASASGLKVAEARKGLRLEAGQVVLARGGMHLTVVREAGHLECRVHRDPADARYFPSVDALFSSASKACGAHVLGVVLTGMGDDGLQGSRDIVTAGGKVLVEAERSCVVYGMPRAVKEADLSSGEAPIERMADAVLRCL